MKKWWSHPLRQRKHTFSTNCEAGRREWSASLPEKWLRWSNGLSEIVAVLFFANSLISPALHNLTHCIYLLTLPMHSVRRLFLNGGCITLELNPSNHITPHAGGKQTKASHPDNKISPASFWSSDSAPSRLTELMPTTYARRHAHTRTHTNKQQAPSGCAFGGNIINGVCLGRRKHLPTALSANGCSATPLHLSPLK